MKSIKTQIASFVALSMIFLGSPATYAAEAMVARDMEVDVALLAAAAPSGILPPTAGNAAGVPNAITGPSLLRTAQGSLVRKPFRKSKDEIDHKAKVIAIEGSAKIQKKENGSWKPLSKGQVIEEGNSILTSANSFVSIAYDEAYLSIAKIDANTKATFRQIEPTDLFLEDGTVFSIVENLKPGEQLQVSTPVAVTAVRGTRFINRFNAQTRDFFAANIPVEQDDRESFVSLTQKIKNIIRRAGLTEGNQLELPGGEELSPKFIEALTPENQRFAENFLEFLKNNIEDFEERRTRAKQAGDPFAAFLPPTAGGNLLVPGTAPQINQVSLDPQLDTGSVPAPDSEENTETTTEETVTTEQFLQNQRTELSSFLSGLSQETDELTAGQKAELDAVKGDADLVINRLEETQKQAFRSFLNEVDQEQNNFENTQEGERNNLDQLLNEARTLRDQIIQESSNSEVGFELNKEDFFPLFELADRDGGREVEAFSQALAFINENFDSFFEETSSGEALAELVRQVFEGSFTDAATRLENLLGEELDAYLVELQENKQSYQSQQKNEFEAERQNTEEFIEELIAKHKAVLNQLLATQAEREAAFKEAQIEALKAFQEAQNAETEEGQEPTDFSERQIALIALLAQQAVARSELKAGHTADLKDLELAAFEARQALKSDQVERAQNFILAQFEARQAFVKNQNEALAAFIQAQQQALREFLDELGGNSELHRAFRAQQQAELEAFLADQAAAEAARKQLAEAERADFIAQFESDKQALIQRHLNDLEQFRKAADAERVQFLDEFLRLQQSEKEEFLASFQAEQEQQREAFLAQLEADVETLKSTQAATLAELEARLASEREEFLSGQQAALDDFLNGVAPEDSDEFQELLSAQARDLEDLDLRHVSELNDKQQELDLALEDFLSDLRAEYFDFRDQLIEQELAPFISAQNEALNDFIEQQNLQDFDLERQQTLALEEFQIENQQLALAAEETNQELNNFLDGFIEATLSTEEPGSGVTQDDINELYQKLRDGGLKAYEDFFLELEQRVIEFNGGLQGQSPEEIEFFKQQFLGLHDAIFNGGDAAVLQAFEDAIRLANELSPEPLTGEELEFFIQLNLIIQENELDQESTEFRNALLEFLGSDQSNLINQIIEASDTQGVNAIPDAIKDNFITENPTLDRIVEAFFEGLKDGGAANFSNAELESIKAELSTELEDFLAKQQAEKNAHEEAQAVALDEFKADQEADLDGERASIEADLDNNEEHQAFEQKQINALSEFEAGQETELNELKETQETERSELLSEQETAQAELLAELNNEEVSEEEFRAAQESDLEEFDASQDAERESLLNEQAGDLKTLEDEQQKAIDAFDSNQVEEAIQAENEFDTQQAEELEEATTGFDNRQAAEEDALLLEQQNELDQADDQFQENLETFDDEQRAAEEGAQQEAAADLEDFEQQQASELDGFIEEFGPDLSEEDLQNFEAEQANELEDFNDQQASDLDAFDANQQAEEQVFEEGLNEEFEALENEQAETLDQLETEQQNELTELENEQAEELEAFDAAGTDTL